MPLDLRRIRYGDLNARQKENYNFQKLSAVLADFGFTTLRLTDDWQGADFIAQHIDGETFLKVQLKGRLTFGQKYVGKDLYVAFEHQGNWYLYPHDDVLSIVLATTNVGNTSSWKMKQGYSFPGLSTPMAALLEPYRISGMAGRAGDSAALDPPSAA